MKLLIIFAGFLVFLLFLVLLAAFLERYWRAYQAEQAAANATDNGEDSASQRGMKQFIAGASSWTAQLQGWLQPAPVDAALGKEFREWVQRDLQKEPGLQSWLLALPDPGFDLLTKHIADFCREMNFDLQWLVAQELAVAPELEAAIKAVVVNYCTACQKAVPAQQQIQFFTIYRQLLQPTKSQHEQRLLHELYATLTTQGVVAAPEPSALITATEAERRQHAIQAVQQAAAQDWLQFMQILQATMHATAPTPAPQAGDAAAGGHSQSTPNGTGASQHNKSTQQVNA